MRSISLVLLGLAGPLVAGSQITLVPEVEVAPLTTQASSVRDRLAQHCGAHAETLLVFDRFYSALRADRFDHMDLIERALLLAAQRHEGQSRKGADDAPYIIHPIGVALILAVEGGILEPNVLAAALLHDTVEDTDTTLDELRELFGERIASIVDEVSDDRDLPKEERKRLQVEHAPHKSREAKLVKLGDKLHNLRSLQQVPPTDWEQTRIDAYFAWAEQVVRGLRGTCDPLEERLDELFGVHV